MATAALQPPRKFSRRSSKRFAASFANANKPLLLIADDYEDTRAMLRCFFEADGYRIVEARDGEEAARITLEKRPDAVLMNVRMPTTNGLGAARHIRSNVFASPKLPLIFVSASSEAAIRATAFAAGATDYFIKPLLSPT